MENRLKVLVAMVGTLVAVVLCTSCQKREPGKPAHTPDANDPNVAEVVGLITEMPAWTSLPAFDVYPQVASTSAATIAKIERAVLNIAKHDSDDIRDAMQVCLEAARDFSDDMDIWSKAFVLNEYLFKLPPTSVEGSSHLWLTGGGGGTWVAPGTSYMPKVDKTVHVRWPWSQDIAGAWHLTGRAIGSEGPPYPALDVFDYYQKTFGRRVNPIASDANTEKHQ